MITTQKIRRVPMCLEVERSSDPKDLRGLFSRPRMHENIQPFAGMRWSVCAPITYAPGQAET